MLLPYDCCWRWCRRDGPGPAPAWSGGLAWAFDELMLAMGRAVRAGSGPGGGRGGSCSDCCRMDARANGWTIAEFAGDAEPAGMQRLLNSAVWARTGSGTRCAGMW